MSIVGAQVRAILRNVSDRKRLRMGVVYRCVCLFFLSECDMHDHRYVGRAVGRSARFVLGCAGFEADTRHTKQGDEGGGGFEEISDV